MTTLPTLKAWNILESNPSASLQLLSWRLSNEVEDEVDGRWIEVSRGFVLSRLAGFSGGRRGRRC